MSFRILNFFGSMYTPNDTMDVQDGLFSDIATRNEYCHPDTKQNCEYRLKRKFDTTKLLIGNKKLRDFIWRYPTFKNFISLIHGQAHGQVHSFVGSAMGNTDTAGEDPLFYLHHTNVDRLWHLWCDCHDYENVDPEVLTDNCTQYVALNPVPESMPQSQWKALDLYKNRYKVGLEDKVHLYSGTTQAIFCTEEQFPTMRELWTMGTESKHGWMDLYYRYGPDKMAAKFDAVVGSIQCKKSWSWVNYSG